MLSMLMTTEYAPAEDRHKLQQLLLHIAGGERDALAALYQRTRLAAKGYAHRRPVRTPAREWRPIPPR